MTELDFSGSRFSPGVEIKISSIVPKWIAGEICATPDLRLLTRSPGVT